MNLRVRMVQCSNSPWNTANASDHCLNCQHYLSDTSSSQYRQLLRGIKVATKSIANAT